MQKDELIQFHMFLLQLKNYLDNMVDNNDKLDFKSYYNLNIMPHDIYKSKRQHKLAVFTLISGITNILSHKNYYGLEELSIRFGKLSETIMTEEEKKLIKS